MTAAPTPTITAYFSAATLDNKFVLDDPVRGMLDNVTYLLGDDIPVDISSQGYQVSIVRGRSRELDQIQTGTMSANLRNETRVFDPDYGAYPGDIRPGKRVTITALGRPLFSGKIEDWTFTYDVSGQSSASFVALDALGDLAHTEFDAWTTTAGQSPGTRIGDVLDRPEVGYFGGRALSAGSSVLQADAVSWGSNVLNYCQLVAQSEVGRFFADASDVVTLKGRNDVAPATSVAFADDGSGIFYGGIQASFGGSLLFTRVSVDRSGGTKQTVTSAAGAALYGVRSLTLGSLLVDSDAQALGIATYLLGKYSTPEWRIASIVVDLSSCVSEAQQASVLGLDIGSVCTVRFVPNGISGAILQTLVVEGVQHDLAPMSHVVTLSFSAANETPFTLDSSTFGLLDGPTLLGF